MLRDELGIRPSPELQQLEQAVLDQDPALDRPSPVHLEPAGAATSRGGTEPAARGLPGVRFPHRLLPQAVLPFAGRGPEYESLLQAWKHTTPVATGCVGVGEAGIGKTRLAAEVARHAHEAGAVVLFGRCDEDMGVPFQPFVEALEQVVQSRPTAASSVATPGSSCVSSPTWLG